MGDRRKLIKGTALLSIGQILAQVSSFIRNMIFAAMLTKHDFGVASTFALTMTAAELVSDMALDRLLVQDKDGNEPAMQATAHLIQLLRGLFSGVVIFALASPISVMFHVPDAAWAYQWIALVPIMRGLMHLDFRRVQREMRYFPSVITDSVPQVLAAIAAWPIVHITGNYEAMIWLILGQSIAMLVLSHVLAERIYSIGWRRAYGIKSVRFGWPLMLNGILLFAALQGDKVIVGAHYTMEQLSDFALAFMVATLPSVVLVRVFSAAFLPWLSRTHLDSDVLGMKASLSMQIMTSIALIVGMVSILAGTAMMTLFFGHRYTSAGVFLAIFGAMTSIRLLRAVPTLVSIAAAKTTIPLYTNIIRSMTLAPVAILAMQHSHPKWLAIVGLFGELVAFVACSLLTAKRCRVDARIFLFPALIFTCITCLTHICSLFLNIGTPQPILIHNIMSLTIAVVVSVVCASALSAFFPQLRIELRNASSTILHKTVHNKLRSESCNL